MFKRKDYKEKQLRYSIRKVSFGAASVAIASLYLFMGSSAVSASEVQPVNGEQNTVTNTEEVKKNEKQTEETDIKKGETLDKTSLTKLIEEIDGKFTNGKYTSKTEDSVNQLKAALEAAKTALSTAQTQAELTQAHANLIVATTKLQTKELDKKEAPVVDTTNGKATVGKKATNTEKASASNSIANSGSKDERNGKEMDKNNPFRTDTTTTDTDPAANQTYTAPAENADLNELKSELLKLPDAVQNNTKIQDMNDLGDKTGVARGDVKEIQEFGGWKAINQPDGTPGKFAIARKTESGIFPVETVNTVFTNIRNGQAQYYDTYVGEQAFDRSKDYMLFLGKVRTIASENEQTFNGKSYSRTGLGGSDSYAIKSFSGIEKTFKAHSPETGSKVKVAFKTGFTGDLNGTKAKYLVEVVYRQNDSEVTAYTYTFEPQPRATVKNDKGIVTPAKDGTGRAYVRSEFNNYTLNKAEVEAKMAEDAYKPNGQAGTFTSSDIDLPAGVTEYTVRIKVTDTERMGMGYQSPLRHYALPVTGLDFSVEQDTRKLAKNLLQRVYDKLKATEAQDIKGKTDETISAYKEQLKNVENLLAGELNPTQTYKDIVTAVLAGQQALRTDKSKLDTSNTKLLDLINETPDPRIGKTPNSITPYDSAKEEAKKAQADAQSILNQENPDPDVVAAAVSKLNEKLAELKAARAELVVAATEDQKTKLKNDSDALKPADTNGKTPKSIEAYNARYKQLEEALNKAKEEAKKVLDKEVNAGKVEATDAQIEVDKIKAELDKAAALLKDKGNTDELENAKNELKTAAEVPNVTDGKTKGTSDKYDAAKTAAEQAVTAAEAVISDINSTTEDVANALAKVNEKKAALEAAKAALVDKVTPEQKTALGNAETDLAVLGDADLAGKTEESKEAYKAEVAKLNAEIEAAKQAAAAIVADADNKTQVEAALAQAKVETLKAKLEAAKAKLVDKADKAALTAAKEALDGQTKEEDPTSGKTTATAEAYKAAKTAAEEAVREAEAIIAKDNATPKEVADALAKVNEKKAALEAAKAALVDKVTPEQKTALGNAETDLAVLGDADLAGKTEESKEAYKAEVAKLNAEIEAAKQAAAAIVADADNKTQAEAALAQAKVETLKAKLEAAKAKLVDKADKAALTAAKEALDGQTKEEDPTSGKTTATAEAYKAAKTAAEEAVREAEAIIAKDNATPKEVADALAKVNEKKAALEAAKAALVDKVTPDQKTALGNAETDLAVLGDADLAGKTEESKEAYKAEVAKLNAEIEAAKQAAAAIVADADNKTQAEAALAQAKVETLKAKLEAAKAKLVDKADKAALTAAKEALDGQTKEEDPTSGKTTATAEAYKAAKTAAEEAVREAEAIIAKDNATPKEVADALAKVNEKKAALEAAKAALVDKISQDQKDDLTNAEENLKLADTTGKTKDSIKAYNDEVAKLSDELEAAKQAAKDLVDKGDNAGELEAYRVQAKINKLKSKLAEAAKLLKDIDKSVAKKEVEDAAKKATDVIVANNDLTSEQKAAAKAKVAEEATKAIDAIDKAKSEDDIKAATDAGKLAIEKEAAKAEIEAAKAAKEKAIEANDKLSDAEKQAAKEEAAKAADEAKKAIDAATDNAGVAGAKTTGTAAVEAVNPVGKDKAKAEIEKELAEKTKAIDTNADLTPDQKAEAKAKIAEEAKKAIDAIDKATTTEEVASAKESGKLAIEKEAAKAEIEAAKAAKEKAIEANDKLSDAEKQAAKEEAAKAADEAKKAIDAATDNAGVAGAKTTGTAAVEAVNPVGKDKAKAEIEKELAEKTKAIDTNADLTPDQKAEAKVKIAEEAKKAIDAIDKATTTEEVASAKESGKLAIEKEAAKAEIEAAKAAKEKAIDARTDLTDEEKATAKARVEEEAEAAKNAIDKATDLSDLDKVTETGKDDIKRVTVTSAKEEAKKAIDEALAAKEKAIDARTDLTDEEKAAAKKAAREEAEAAKKAIDKATTLEDINKVLEDEKANIAKINPAGAKEEAKKAIDEALVAKEKAIDARTDLTDEEKAVAKKAAREEAEAAKKAIDKATTLEDINKVLEDEKANIAKINPAGAKEEAKKAIDEALVAKEKAIDARTDLTDEEKAVAKKAAREEAEAAKNAIDKATTSEDINKVLEDGKANIAKINPVGAKEEAKKAIDEALAAKEKAIDARTDLTDEEKAVAKKAAREEAEAAKNAIDKATTSEDINKVLEDGKANIAKINPVGTKEDSKKSIEERLTDKENRQPNNTPVKPQEDAKPAEVSSDNSEQPAVNQTEDVKGNSSTTSQESKASNQKVLPNTGTGNEISIFGSAAMTVLASLGLVATSKKKEEE